MNNLFYENIYELIKTICICFGLGIWTFICIWLGYIAGHSKGYDKGKKEGSIEELEKIYNKIDSYYHTKDPDDFEIEYNRALAEIQLCYINKRISELKGEQFITPTIIIESDNEERE